MAQNTLTLKLGGDAIPVGDFAEAMQQFSKLIKALSAEIVGPDSIEWNIAELDTGSAVATIAGFYEEEEQVDRVVAAYAKVGQALQDRDVIPYSSSVIKPAMALAGLINGHVKSIAMDTDRHSTLVSEPLSEEDATKNKLFDYGMISGRLETVGGRKQIEMRVREQIYGYSVVCYAEPRFEDAIRKAWRRNIVVHGRIHRDLDTGRPIEVRSITAVEVPPEPRDFDVRAIFELVTYEPGQEAAEDSIRRIRDGE